MREVVITDTAKADLEQIVSFLQKSYSNKVKIDFLVRFTEKLLLIESMPFMYAASIDNPRVRRCLIHKNTVCFYEVSDDKIFVLSIVDARANPQTGIF